jgi:hypothetical protein
VLIALVIFATIVLAWCRGTDNALLAAGDANATRVLRLLTCRKMSEIRAKPSEYVEGGEGGFEEEVDYGEENPFLDYRWEVEAEEVVAAGYSGEGEAKFLFDRDKEGGEPPAPEGGKAPDPVTLLRLVLTVSHVPEGSDSQDRMRAVLFVPAPKEEPGQAGR